MERNYLISIGLIIGCILFLQVSCQKQTVPPEEPDIELAKTKPAVSPEKAEIVPEANESTPKITFEDLAYDFGEVGPKTRKTGELKFKNTGDGLLKITKVETCCGCSNKLSKREYAPGESGICSLGRLQSMQRVWGLCQALPVWCPQVRSNFGQG